MLLLMLKESLKPAKDCKGLFVCRTRAVEVEAAEAAEVVEVEEAAEAEEVAAAVPKLLRIRLEQQGRIKSPMLLNKQASLVLRQAMRNASNTLRTQMVPRNVVLAT